jgi:hypothetical protein
MNQPAQELQLDNVSVTFTHEVADGMHGAIVKAGKPIAR